MHKTEKLRQFLGVTSLGSNIVRQFVRPPSSSSAVDTEGGIKIARGMFDADDAHRMIHRQYELRSPQSKHGFGFGIEEPFYPDQPIIDGIRIVENYVGRPTTPIAQLLKGEKFCAFVGSHFEFLQYLS